MTKEEAIEYNKNLREYMRITDKESEYGFLEENYIALDMAIKSLEAWKEVIEEIQQKFEGCDVCEWVEDYDWDENNISDYRQVGSVEDIFGYYKEAFGSSKMMKYIFIGEDHSMGFRCGLSYELKTEIIRNTIVVSCKELNVRCPYSSVEAFLRNWTLSQKFLERK